MKIQENKLPLQLFKKIREKADMISKNDSLIPEGLFFIHEYLNDLKEYLDSRNSTSRSEEKYDNHTNNTYDIVGSEYMSIRELADFLGCEDDIEGLSEDDVWEYTGH